jgi:ribosomal-protein-alanine N-acetyltransferase
MGTAVVDHAFSALGLLELVGFTRPTNRGSRRVLEKLGFTYERAFVSHGVESVLYRLSAAQRPAS